MTVIQIILGVVILLFSIAITIIVLLQEGHQSNLGTISGGADSFLGKSKARSVDAFLGKWTKTIAIGFFVLIILINAILFFA